MLVVDGNINADPRDDSDDSGLCTTAHSGDAKLIFEHNGIQTSRMK